MNGMIDRIGLVSTQILPMTIVAAIATVKTTVVLDVKHAETTSIRGRTGQAQHIALGGQDIHNVAGIVDDCNQTKPGQHIPVNLR